MKTVWLALWHQLTASTQTAYACRRGFQDLDTGAKGIESLSQSISKLEGSLSEKGGYGVSLLSGKRFVSQVPSDISNDSVCAVARPLA